MMKSFLLNSPMELATYLGMSFDLFMPTKTETGDVRWASVENDVQLAPNENSSNSQFEGKVELPVASCKAFFFPEREDIFHFDGKRFVSKVADINEQVLFGVRACDLMAIAYQDRFFSHDTYYQARREKSLLVGIDCMEQCDQGFCHQVDAGPFVRANTADLILSSTHTEASSWKLLVVSDKGFDAINGFNLKEDLQTFDTKSRETKQLEIIKEFSDDSYLNAGIKKINQNKVSDSQWSDLAKQCVTCTGCTQICPTCSCYATRDLTDSQAGDITRERYWDSCLYEGFQKEASGNNPSDQAGERLKRYWYHKFSDDFVKQFDRVGCVGCGRCERVCPGVIGVHSIMKRLNDDE